jgi:hypothetical protein
LCGLLRSWKATNPKRKKNKKNTSESATGYTTEKIQRDTLGRKL